MINAKSSVNWQVLKGGDALKNGSLNNKAVSKRVIYSVTIEIVKFSCLMSFCSSA